MIGFNANRYSQLNDKRVEGILTQEELDELKDLFHKEELICGLDYSWRKDDCEE